MNKPSKVISKYCSPITTGLWIYIVYLLIFYATWVVNGAQYTSIGESTDTVRLWYAIPTLLASSFLLIIVTYFGLWKVVLFDKQKSGQKWAYIIPIVIFMAIGTNILSINLSNLTFALLFWSVAGGIGVGLGEEIITRGTLLVGLRSKYKEGLVWLISTLLFAALHIPNIFFGLAVNRMLVQLVLTFIMGTAFYIIRRTSGTLILSIVLHGLWDTSVFLPQATGGQPNAIMAMITFLVVLFCAIPFLRKNWNLRMDTY